jgi:hypothetical protein
MHGRAVVVTADPDDILRLASAMPAVRIVTRSARWHRDLACWELCDRSRARMEPPSGEVTHSSRVALLGVLPGIAIAVGLSILNVFRRAWWPYDTELGR